MDEDSIGKSPEPETPKPFNWDEYYAERAHRGTAPDPALARSRDPARAVNLGCFVASMAVFGTGTLLWILRPPDWGIPGIVCFGIMGLGWSFLTVTWKQMKGGGKPAPTDQAQR